MGKRAEKNRATTAVTLGWLVKKRYRDAQGKERIKSISKRMISESAAGTFRDIAAKGYTPVEGESQVEFFVTEDLGFDDIRANV